MMNNNIMLTIEEELAGPEKEAAMKKYDQILLNLENRRKTAMDKGLTAEDFKKSQLLENAVTLARKLIRLQIKS